MNTVTPMNFFATDNSTSAREEGGFASSSPKYTALRFVFILSLMLSWASNAQAQTCSNPNGTAEVNWLLNGDLIDSSGNGIGLTSTGATPAYSTIATEGSNSVDTTNQPILQSNDALFNNSFTRKSMSMNIRTATPAIAGTLQYLYEEGGDVNGIAMRLNATGELILSVSESSVTRTCRVDYPTDGEFHQIGFVYDGRAGINEAWLYLDGYPVCSVNAFSALAAHGSGVGIGTNIGSASGQPGLTTNAAPFSGLIDDVSVFSGVDNLTPKQMLDIADCSLAENFLTDLAGTTCPVQAYLVQNDTGDWYGIDLITGNDTLGADNQTFKVNAIGFNEIDGRIWGACADETDVACKTNQLVITSANTDGTYTSAVVGPISGLPDGISAFIVGEVYDGVYYVTIGNNALIYAIDADPTSSTYLQVINTLTVSPTRDVVDFAVNPVDGFAYGLALTTGRLIQFNLTTGASTDLGISGVDIIGATGWGAVYFDDEGYFYTSNNVTGDIYRIDLTTNPGSNYDESKTAFFSPGPSSTNNDGARCPGPVPIDYGDAPSPDQVDANGTAYGFCTALEDDGARHGNSAFNAVTNTGELSIGALLSIESDGQPSTTAARDTYDDGVATLPLIAVNATSYPITVAVANTTGVAATLCGWIDSDASLTFTDDATDCVSVPAGATSVSLAFSLNQQQVNGTVEYFMRLRIASDAAEITGPCGPATNGEVEDYLIPVGTLPVTLSNFDSARSGNKVQIYWSTGSELFNVGFQLWGLDGTDSQWDKLHNRLIKSGSGNAVEPQSYGKRVRIPKSIEQLISVGISSVDSDGSEHYYGPFELGKAYGDLTRLEPIAWDNIRSQTDVSMATKGYVKNGVNGYRKASSQALSAAASSDSITAAEFSVSKDGLYRITSAQLLAKGLDWSSITRREFALLDSAGHPVVRYLRPRGSGKGLNKTFGAGGEIYFYGLAPDASARLYTDSSVYRLVLDSTRARRAPTQRKQGISRGFETQYIERSRVEHNKTYIVSSAADDPWLDASLLSYPDQPTLYGDRIPVQADADYSQPSQLRLGLGRASWLNAVDTDDDGQIDAEHRVEGLVYSNGTLLALSSETAIGKGTWEVGFEIPADTPLTLFDNNILGGGSFSAGAGYAFSRIDIDWLEYVYTRPLSPKADDAHLLFSTQSSADVGYDVILPDQGRAWAFATDGTNLVRIVPESQRRVHDASGAQQRVVKFAALQGAGLSTDGLKYWVSSLTSIPTVSDLTAITVPSRASLLAGAQGSDYILISHPTFMGASLVGYAAHKQRQGYGVSVVDYLEIESVFGGGQAGPRGLTAYLNALEAGGGIDNVLLVGGSTYDHTGLQGTGAITFIPSHYGQSDYSKFTVSDAPYVMDGNGALFASIGRWPVRSEADLQAIVDKSIVWANADHSSGAALLIAEHTLDGENINFGSALDGIAQHLPGDYAQTRVYVDQILSVNDDAYPSNDITLTQALAQAKSAIITGLNMTPDIVLYNGHAGTRQLSNQNLFKSADITQVTASGAEVWLPMSCYTTFYESTHVNTLAHQLLFSGNAVNITGATLLSNQSSNVQMSKSILDRTMGQGQTLGAAVMASKQAQRNPRLTINWALLGDPTATF